LARRGLSRPNGDMLFSYRTTSVEYASLRGLFSDMLAALQGTPWLLRSPSECAAFVLYAAEWWRREYAGGPWRWTTILDSLGQPYRLDVLERTAAVERGLKAWGHRPSGHGKKYLGAIVAHGGLPLQLVARGDGSIVRLLTRGTRLAQVYGWDGQRLEGFFQAHQQELVQHLRDEEIYRLLASVVTMVLSLRRDHRLAGVSNPVEVLERQQPDWRNLFPIVVEADQAAEALLAGLVREAAREVVRGAVYPVTAMRTLQPAGDASHFHLVTAIEMPSSVSLESLAGATGLGADAIPQAFSVDLVGAERILLAEARQLLGSEQQMVVLSGKSRVLRGEDSVQELRFVARSKGADLHAPVAIPGGDELDESQPWVFVERDSAWVLSGVGGCRVAEDNCFMALPEGGELRPVDADATIAHRGEMRAGDVSRALYEVSGHIEALIDAAVFPVRTRQTVNLSEQLIWRGQREIYESQPFPVYRGVPKLYRVGDDGVPIQVSERLLVWTAATRTAQRVDQPRTHLGPIDAWLTADGVRIRRFRMVLLPEQAKLRFRSGADDRSGAIEFLNWGLEHVDVSSEASAQLDRSEATVKVALSSCARPPAYVGFHVTWASSPYALRLRLPFPASGARFALVTGEELGKGRTVSVARMAAVRVQVLDRNPERPQRYKLIAELDSGSRPRVEQPILIGSDGSGELRLLDIEASLQGLLCQSDLLDVKLSLRVQSGATKLAELSVIRYDVELEREEHVAALSMAQLQALSSEQLSGVKLCALPLLRAEFVEQELQQGSSAGVPTGRWDLSLLTTDGSPWLVFPASDSVLVVRPMLYRPRQADGVEGRPDAQCLLASSMAIETSDDRFKALDDAVAVMSEDYDHPSWRLVGRQYQALSHLPLSTLDYWRAFARIPAGSLAVLLKLSHDMPQLAIRMREELGVVWELMPRAALRDGIKRLGQSWARQLSAGEGDATVMMLTERIFRQLATSEATLLDRVELTLFQAGFGRTEHLDRLFGEMRGGARALAMGLWSGQESLLQRYLLRTHLDDEFWPGFDLTDALVKKLQQRAEQGLSLLLNACDRNLQKLFWLPTLGLQGPYSRNVKQDVANVPVLCGLLSEFADDAAMWWNPGEIDQIRQLRAFAPAWFEVACRLGRLMALSTRQQPPSRPAHVLHEGGEHRVWQVKAPPRNRT
jgi:hypothetical protein